MKNKSGFKVSAVTAIRVPAIFALPAVDAALKEFAHRPGSGSLAVNVQELGFPLAATVGIPIEASVSDGRSRHEWEIEMRSATRAHMYPSFTGVLSVTQAGASGCELRLEGEYMVPLGEIGRVIDLTLFKGIAQSSLQRFVHDIAARVMAERMQWALMA